MALSVCNHSVTLVSLVLSEVPSISVKISGNFHGSGRETVPDRCVPNLPSGQKLFNLDHRVPFMEGRSHAEDNSPCLSSVLCRIVCHKDSVNTAVKGQRLEHSGDHFHGITVARKANGLAKLRNTTKEEVS